MVGAEESPLRLRALDELLRYRQSGGNWRIGRVQNEGRHGVIESALDLLARLRETWVAPQPAGVLDALVDSTRLFETLALVPRGVFDSDCVRMLQGHARSWQDGGGVGLDDYLAGVDELANNTSRATLDEPDDRDDDAVRISTIHSAKGLEFSVVALAGMSIGTPNFPEVVGVRSDGESRSTLPVSRPRGTRAGRKRSAGRASEPSCSVCFTSLAPEPATT